VHSRPGPWRGALIPTAAVAERSLHTCPESGRSAAKIATRNMLLFILGQGHRREVSIGGGGNVSGVESSKVLRDNGHRKMGSSQGNAPAALVLGRRFGQKPDAGQSLGWTRGAKPSDVLTQAPVAQTVGTLFLPMRRSSRKPMHLLGTNPWQYPLVWDAAALETHF
jgi:hypothetical protein